MFKSFLSMLPPLMLAALGVALIWFGIHQISLSRQQLSWPTTKGIVSASKYISDDSPPDEIRVDCSYQVSGQDYDQPIYVVPQTAGVIPETYQAGAEVVIYYDPKNAARAVLEPGENSGGGSWITLGSIVLHFAAPWLIFTGLLLYADVMMAVARRHMRKGLQALKEAEAEFEQVISSTDADDSNAVFLEELRAETLERARAAADLYREVETERESFESTENTGQIETVTDSARPHSPVDRELTLDSARLLFVSDRFEPGELVEIHRPPASGGFLLGGAIALGGFAAVAVYFLVRNVDGPMFAPFLAAGIVGAIVGNLVVIYLQGLQPGKQIRLDWNARAIVEKCGKENHRHSFNDLRRLSFRGAETHCQLDAELTGGTIRLFESDDFGARSSSLPLDQVAPLAESLAKALNVELMDDETMAEPVRFRQIWRRSPTSARWTLLCLVIAFLAPWLFGPRIPALVIAPTFVAAISAIVVPVASGILIGLSLVRQGRTNLANISGFIAMILGGGIFGTCASLNREDFWQTFPGGTFLGPLGTYGGFAILLFGMGLFLRNARKPYIG